MEPTPIPSHSRFESTRTMATKTLLLSFAAALVAGALSSCIYYDEAPPYSSYGSSPPPSGYVHSRPTYGRTPSSFIGSGYGYGHGHHNHKHEEERIKLTGGSQKGKGTRPSEYHTREWFEKKGYDLSNYKHKHEYSGVTHTGSKYGKESSSSRKSKSSGKKKKKKK